MAQIGTFFENPADRFQILTEDVLRYHDAYAEIPKPEVIISNENIESDMNSHFTPVKKKHDDSPKEANPRLEAGKCLPHSFGDYFPKKKLAGIPLVEIDQFYYKKQTFVVISSDKTIFRFSTTKAFFLLSSLNPIRKTAIRILTHPVFSFLVLTTILINCVFMAKNSNSDIVEYVFTTIYTLEFTIKAISRGLIVNEFTYLRDAWNWLDFIVIGLAYLMFFFPVLGNLSALRSLRVLRALKTVTTVPGMKTVVGALLEAVKQLRDAMVLTVFLLSIFALIGLQLYRGTLLRKCVKHFNESTFFESETLLYEYENLTEARKWSIKFEFFNNETNWLDPLRQCQNYSYNDWNTSCPEGYVCVQTKTGNPNYGYTNFDNFIVSLLCAFRLMTQDYWENLYQLTIRTNGDIHILYFMMVIFFGSFYLINVILAIVAMSYDDVRLAIQAEEAGDEAERKEQEEMREKIIDRIDEELGIESSEDLNYQLNENAVRPHSKDGWSIQSYVRKPSYIKPGLVEDFNSRSYQVSNIDLNSEPRFSICDYDSAEKNLGSTRLVCPLENYYNGKIKFNYVDKSESEATTPILPHSPRSLVAGKRVIGSFSSFSPILDERGSKTYLDPNLLHTSNSRMLAMKKISEIDGAFNVKRQLSQKLRRRMSKNLSFRHRIENESINSDIFIKVNQEDDNMIPEINQYIKNPELQSALSALSIYETETKIKKKELIKQWLLKTFCSWTCCPCYFKFQNFVALIILDPFVELFITLCIIMNTVLMAIDSPNISSEMNQFLKCANYFFTTTFGLEAFMKLIALGPEQYFQEHWNIFDFIIVVLSLVEIPLDSSGMSLLRAFRLLRVFKLAKSWQTMNLLFMIIGTTVGAIGNLCIVLGIIIFIFAVVGMQLFGDKYSNFRNETLFPTFKGLEPRWNFNDFTHSFMIVFRVLCGEWIESMWDCMLVNGYQCVPFFLMTMILGNLVLLNLFLALLLSSFGSESLQKREDDSNETNKLQEAIDRIYRAIVWVKIQVRFVVKITKKFFGGCMRKKKNLIKNYPTWNLHNIKCDKSYYELSLANDVKLPEDHLSNQELWFKYSLKETEVPKFDEDPEINEVEIIYSTSPEDCLPNFISRLFRKCYDVVFETPPGRLWWNSRCLASKLVEHQFFETFIILMIIISSLTLTLEDKYLPSRPWLKIALEIMDKVFTIIFTAEMLLKWFAFGLNKYFKDAWCWLDFIIVTIALVSLVLSYIGTGAGGMGAFKAMRTLRALRPLRAVSRWEGMRIVVNALIQAIPSIFNVLLVCLVFWLIFSIIGMQLFGGKFYKCVNNDTFERISAEIIPNKNACLIMKEMYGNVSWENSQLNFDNVLNGYLCLFQVATFKGWIEIMADAVDSTGIGNQPIYNHSTVYYIYFVLFIIFGAFFTLNLFIGVIIDNFNVQKKRVGGSIEMFMTEDQKKYYNAMKKMSSTAPQKPIPRPKLKIANIIFSITINQKFDIFIMAVIMLNTIVMCIEHWDQSEKLKNTLDQINKVFVVIFTGEFALKLIAQRWYYFKVPWNIFDFVIVILSIVFWAIESMLNNIPVSPTFIRVVRVFRIGRILRLVKSAKGIRTLLFSLIVSLPALLNIALLLIMIMFIYAIVGMSFFSTVAYSHSIDEVFNFETFGKSMIILFQISTSGGWNGVLNGLMNEDPKICSKEKGNCGSYILAVVYLISYLIISFLVIINMYIAVILENFSQATKDVQEGLTQDDYDLFYECWEEYDTKARGFISLKYLGDFVEKIDKPLGIPKPNSCRLALLEIPICQNDTVYCVDLLEILTRRFLGQKPEADSGDNNINKLKPNLKIGKVEKIIISNTLQRQRENFAAKVIIKYMRRYTEKLKQSRKL